MTCRQLYKAGLCHWLQHGSLPKRLQISMPTQTVHSRNVTQKRVRSEMSINAVMVKECSMTLIMDKGGSIVASIDTKHWLKLPRHSLKGTMIELM